MPGLRPDEKDASGAPNKQDMSTDSTYSTLGTRGGLPGRGAPKDFKVSSEVKSSWETLADSSPFERSGLQRPPTKTTQGHS
jgi:hypothetical protein